MELFITKILSKLIFSDITKEDQVNNLNFLIEVIGEMYRGWHKCTVVYYFPKYSSSVAECSPGSIGLVIVIGIATHTNLWVFQGLSTQLIAKQ